MFATGLKEIYSKIKGMKGKERQTAFLYLESQILGNPAIKHQYELLSFVKKHRNSLVNQESFSKFVRKLKEKNINFIKESKLSHLALHKENKKLLEYFNINPRELSVSDFDLAVDMYSNSTSLNENALKKIVLRKSRREEKNEFRRNLEEIRESFDESFTKSTDAKSKKEERKYFKIINFLSECMPSKQKMLIKSSLQSLFESNQKRPNLRKTNLNKLFKLRVIAEKIMKENEDDYSDWHADKFDVDDIKTAGGKIIRPQNLNHIKKISIEIPPAKAQKLIIKFDVIIYPTGTTTNEIKTSLAEIKEKIERLERDFIRPIYQSAKMKDNLLDPVGTIWLAKIGNFQREAGLSNYIRVFAYMNIKSATASPNEVSKSCYDLLMDFDEQLPNLMGDFGKNLSPEELGRKGKIKTKLVRKYIDKNRDTGLF